LIAGGARRRAALREYAAWLEALAARAGEAAGAARPEGQDAGQPLPGLADTYEPLRRLMAAQVTRLAAQARRQGAPKFPDGEAVRTALVAWLAHAQVLRLCGPAYEGGLRWEAALVRGLQSTLDGAPSPSRPPRAR
jgi:hypothetical protein